LFHRRHKADKLVLKFGRHKPDKPNQVKSSGLISALQQALADIGKSHCHFLLKQNLFFRGADISEFRM